MSRRRRRGGNSANQLRRKFVSAIRAAIEDTATEDPGCVQAIIDSCLFIASAFVGGSAPRSVIIAAARVAQDAIRNSLVMDMTSDRVTHVEQLVAGETYMAHDGGERVFVGVFRRTTVRESVGGGHKIFNELLVAGHKGNVGYVQLAWPDYSFFKR